MVALFRDQRDLVDVVAWANKQEHAPAKGRHPIDHDWPDRLHTGLAPKLDDERCAEEQHRSIAAAGDDLRFPQSSDAGNGLTVVAYGPDQPGGDILRAASGFQTPNREGVRKRQNSDTCHNAFAGPFGLSEEALVRLEAGLHAQREQLVARPAQLGTAPGICPGETPVQAALCAQDTTQRLPRAAQLSSSPEFTLSGNEGRVPPDTFNFQPSPPCEPVRLQSPSPSKERSLNWGPRLLILISTLMAALVFPVPELAPVNSEVSEPAHTLPQHLSGTTQANKEVDSQLSRLEPATSDAPVASAQHAASIQPPAQPATVTQSTTSFQIGPPFHGDASSRRSQRGHKNSSVGSPVHETQLSMLAPDR